MGVLAGCVCVSGAIVLVCDYVSTVRTRDAERVRSINHVWVNPHFFFFLLFFLDSCALFFSLVQLESSMLENARTMQANSASLEARMAALTVKIEALR